MRRVANDQLTLQINKINLTSDNDRLRYNQRERGKSVDVTVIDANGASPYDLTGKKLQFVDEKEGHKIILDDGSAPDSGGKFVVTDTKNGKFTYTFVDQTYQRTGIAHFEFITDSEHIDASSNFEIEIDNGVNLTAANESYLSSMAAMEDHLNSAIKNATNSINQINASTEDAKKYANDTLSSLQSTYNSTIGGFKKQLDTFTSTASQKVSDLAKQADSALSDWNTQKAAIQKTADDQIAAIKDTDKQAIDAAVKSITDKRDQALSEANTNFTNKLNSIQSDYDNWKTKTVADFDKAVSPIKEQIDQNNQKLSETQQQVKAAIEQMQKVEQTFSQVDFTKFAHISDVYTKAEVDAKLKTAGKVKTVNNQAPDSNGNISLPQPDMSAYETKEDSKRDHYLKTEVDAKLTKYMDKRTWTESDGTYEQMIAWSKAHPNTVIEYQDPTSAIIDGKRVTIDDLKNAIDSIESALGNKANSSDLTNYLLKSDAASTYATKSDLANAGKVKTVNNQAPDANGNIAIDIPVPDMSSYAKQSDLSPINQDIAVLKKELPVKLTQAQFNGLKTKEKDVLYEITDG